MEQIAQDMIACKKIRQFIKENELGPIIMSFPNGEIKRDSTTFRKHIDKGRVHISSHGLSGFLFDGEKIDIRNVKLTSEFIGYKDD